MYKEELMEHFKNPCNYGVLNSPDFVIMDENPSCGDFISIYGKVENGLLINVSFTGKGCVLSQATASILTERFIRTNLDKILQISRNDILDMLGLELGPVRIKCAMLPLLVLQAGIKSYQRGCKND